VVSAELIVLVRTAESLVISLLRKTGSDGVAMPELTSAGIRVGYVACFPREYGRAHSHLGKKFAL